MRSVKIKQVRRRRRKLRVRKKVQGSAERPRLTVTRTLKHIYAQLIDDDSSVTLCSAGSLDKDLRASVPYGGNVQAAKVVGLALAERAKAKGIARACFDRNAYKYHGRVKALAEGAREGGLTF